MTEWTATFLGTGGSWPTKQRGPSAIVLKRGAHSILLDCGEGTQRQLQFSGVSFQSIQAIILTHYHGDHCFGLPGLLKTMALNERKESLQLIGPKGLLRMVDGFRQIGGWPKEFPIDVREVAPGETLDCAGVQAEFFAGKHSVNNLCVRLSEPTRPGKFNKPRALELGIPEGKAFGQLQRRESVTLEDGRVIKPEDVLGPDRPGRVVAYSGDTRPCEGLTDAARDATLFICEASFTKDLQDRAEEVAHMCAYECAETALAAGAKQLALTHITPRYKDASPVLEEAQQLFANTVLAADLLQIEIKFD